MKSVLFVAESINLTGGVTRTLLELLRRTDPAAYDVTLLLMRPHASDLSAIPEHVTVLANDYDLPYRGAGEVLTTFLRHGRLGSAASYACALVGRKVRKDRAAFVRFFTKRHPAPGTRFDIAVAYGMLDTYSNQFVAERVIADRKVMWHHIDAALYSDQELSGMEPVFAQFDAINCVSTGAQESLLHRFPSLADRARVRLNIIDAGEIHRLAREPGPVRPAGVLALATVGRITPEKGTDLLVSVATMLRAQGHEFVWWVVGPDHHPEFAAEVKARCAEAGLGDAVKFVGAQANPLPFVMACDIYVQPSRVEGYGMTTAEAKVLGKPTVRTESGGAAEQFEHRVNGSIVPATAESLFQEVAWLIDRPEARESYRTALRSEAQSAPPDAAWFLD